MQTATQFTRGDVVIHPRRPEWGDGVVDQAVTTTHEGKAAQRLVVRFSNQGSVTINTGVATLVRKDAISAMTTTTTPSFATALKTGAGAREGASGGSGGSEGGGGWLASLGSGPQTAELHRLPEAMTDPFASIQKRLTATLESYRYSTEPRSLVDWGCAQTGLNDPLSKYTRHELEQAFPRFARDRDHHLNDLIRTLKKQGKASLIEEVLRSITLPAARTALQRAIKN
jgi:hypothetical protein